MPGKIQNFRNQVELISDERSPRAVQLFCALLSQRVENGKIDKRNLLLSTACRVCSTNSWKLQLRRLQVPRRMWKSRSLQKVLARNFNIVKADFSWILDSIVPRFTVYYDTHSCGVLYSPGVHRSRISCGANDLWVKILLNCWRLALILQT